MYIQNMFEYDQVKVFDDFNEYFTDEFDSFCEVLGEYFENIGCIIKNPAFSEENEVRIIYDPKLPRPEAIEDSSLTENNKYFKETQEKNKFTISPIKYTKKLNQLVAFADLNFSKLIAKDIIKEIVIGPRAKISEDDIYYFMLSNGYKASEIKITHSEATYR